MRLEVQLVLEQEADGNVDQPAGWLAERQQEDEDAEIDEDFPARGGWQRGGCDLGSGWSIDCHRARFYPAAVGWAKARLRRAHLAEAVSIVMVGTLSPSPVEIPLP